MQFDGCVAHDDNAMQMMARQYTAAGYTMPAVIFWNIASYSNVPVDQHQNGAVLVSGFSPAILRGVLAADWQSLTPIGMMQAVIMDPRYDVVLAD
jgi:hypothetical protein